MLAWSSGFSWPPPPLSPTQTLPERMSVTCQVPTSGSDMLPITMFRGTLRCTTDKTVAATYCPLPTFTKNQNRKNRNQTARSQTSGRTPCLLPPHASEAAPTPCTSSCCGGNIPVSSIHTHFLLHTMCAMTSLSMQGTGIRGCMSVACPWPRQCQQWQCQAVAVSSTAGLANNKFESQHSSKPKAPPIPTHLLLLNTPVTPDLSEWSG